MRHSALLVGSIVALLSVAGCAGDATSPARTDAPEARLNSSTLRASISGPPALSNGVTCTWYVQVQGGTPPYTYWWSTSGMINQGPDDADYWTGYKAVYTWGSLDVQVADALGRSTWARSFFVEDSWSDVDCGVVPPL